MADTITDGFKNSSHGIPLLGGTPSPRAFDAWDCYKLIAEQAKVRETNGKILPSWPPKQVIIYLQKTLFFDNFQPIFERSF